MTADDSQPAFSEPGEADTPGQERLGDDQPDAGPRYQRQGLLGEGGMGRVYVARDPVLRRQVALKVAANPPLAARLATEAWITAQLEHPGIVAVYDAGQDDGQAWYAMRLIRGRTLRQRLADCASTAARLDLLPHLHAACQAVAYAHAMGIVHRDLKPANVMVGEFGETQVADWGLARPLDEARADWSRVVGAASVLSSGGTPRYMSPEQARGEPATRASDVFCLGAALFELLAGRPPPDEPGRPPDLHAVPGDAPAELVAVARRALAVDPTDRYPSAVELAEDLGRWLAGRRVHAHEYRPTELLRRLVVAWRAPLAVAAVAFVVLAAVGVLAARSTAAGRALADAHYTRALAQQALVAQRDGFQPEARVLAAHALSLGPSPLAAGVLMAAEPVPAERVSSQLLPAGCAHAAVVSPDAGALACHGGDGLEVFSLPSLAPAWAAPVQPLVTPTWVGAHLLVVTENGLAWATADGVTPALDTPVTVFAGATGAFAVQSEAAWWVAPDQPPTPMTLCAASVSAIAAAGRRLVVGCDDGWLRTWDAAGDLVAEHALGERPPWSALVVRGDDLLVGGLDGSVARLDSGTGRTADALDGLAHAVRQLLVLPGTPLVVVRGDRGGPRLWHTGLHAWVGALPAGASGLAAGAAPGQLLVLGETLERWQVAQTPAARVLDLSAGVSHMALSPDGTELAVALGTGEVVRIGTADGRVRARHRLGEGVVKAVAFTRQGELAAAAMDVQARVLRGPDRSADLILGSGRVLRRLGALADGRLWGLTYSDAALLFDGPTGAVLELRSGVPFVDGASAHDGSTAVLADAQGGVWLRADGDWTRVQQLDGVVAVAVGPGGSPVVAGTRRSLCIDARCGPAPGVVAELAVAEGIVAVGTLDGELWLLDAAHAQVLAELPGHRDRVSTVVFSPDGAHMVSGSWDGTVRRWTLADLDQPAGQLLAEAQARWGLDLDRALGAL